MSAKTLSATALLALATSLLPIPVGAQARPMSRSTEASIEETMRAGPPEITRDATIMAWPEVQGGEPTELRAGTNEWTCFASSPAALSRGDRDPMCVDEAGLEFLTAWQEQRRPQIDQVTVVYMLEGDAGASNTDPRATQETPDNDWVEVGPHLMIAVPDPETLRGMTTDPDNGGPWVMWSGTPHAHIMVPVPEGSTSMRR